MPLLIFIVSIIVRVAAAVFLNNIGTQRLWEYDIIARNLISGNGFTHVRFGVTYHSLVVPLYTFLNAIIYKLSNNNYYAMLSVQIILASIIPVLVFKIANLLYNDKKVALLAAVLAIFHPGLIVFASTMLHALTLYSLMFCLLVFMFIVIRRSPTRANQLLLGLCGGLSILTRPTAILFILLACVWLFFILNMDLLKKVKFFTIIFIVIAIIISPWLIRNYLIHKQLILQTTTGELFWRGNNEKAVGPATLPDGRAMAYEMPADLKKKIYSAHSEIEQNNIFFEEGIIFIHKHPLLFIKLFFKKLFYFWWFSPSTGINYPHTWFLLYRVYYAFLLILFLLGVFQVFKKSGNILKRDFVPLLLLFILVSLSQSLFYVDGRHRWEIEALFLIPASSALLNLIRIKKRGKLT